VEGFVDFHEFCSHVIQEQHSIFYIRLAMIVAEQDFLDDLGSKSSRKETSVLWDK
jgi:hypothetical protein